MFQTYSYFHYAKLHDIDRPISNSTQVIRDLKLNFSVIECFCFFFATNPNIDPNILVRGIGYIISFGSNIPVLSEGYTTQSCMKSDCQGGQR